MGAGMSDSEIASALGLDEAEARQLVDAITAFLRARGHNVDASGLTETEDAVRTLTESGMTQKRVAQQIGLSPRGVEDVVHRVRAKLGMGSREHLVGRSVIPKRQREVAELIADGLTDEAIGRRLGVSPRTVESHVGRLLRRLGVRHRGEVHEALVRADEDPDQVPTR